MCALGGDGIGGVNTGNAAFNFCDKKASFFSWIFRNKTFFFSNDNSVGEGFKKPQKKKKKKMLLPVIKKKVFLLARGWGSAKEGGGASPMQNH